MKLLPILAASLLLAAIPSQAATYQHVGYGDPETNRPYLLDKGMNFIEGFVFNEACNMGCDGGISNSFAVEIREGQFIKSMDVFHEASINHYSTPHLALGDADVWLREMYYWEEYNKYWYTTGYNGDREEFALRPDVTYTSIDSELLSYGGPYLGFDIQTPDLICPASGPRCDDIARVEARVDYSLRLNVVPIPAAVWLFGSAILGLGFWRKRVQG